MSVHEEQMSKLLDFPYDAFLMIRLEYVQILGDELEAKCLRIIEKYIEQERKRLYQQATSEGQHGLVEIPKDISVCISHKTFMNDLFGTVTAENTVKRAIKNLAHKHIVFTDATDAKRKGGVTYQMNTPLLQGLLHYLTLRYQSLIPSIFDTIAKEARYQKMTPSWYQDLLSSRLAMVSKIDTHITVISDNITDNRDGDSLRAESVAPHTRDFGLTEADCQPDLTDLEETVKAVTPPKATTVPPTEIVSQQTPLRAVQSPQQALPAASVAPVQPGRDDGQVTAEQRRVPAASGMNDTIPDRARAAANVPTAPPAPPKRDTNPALPVVKRAGKRAAKSDTATAPDEDADAVALRTAIYNQIVKRRGFAYDTGGRVVAERTCIKTRLAGHYSAAEIDRVHEYLMTRDWKWSKIDNRYHVNACVIADNMKPVLQILAQERDAAPPEQNGVRMNGHRTNPQPVYEIDEARNAHNLAMAKEMAARKRAEREAKAGVK